MAILFFLNLKIVAVLPLAIMASDEKPSHSSCCSPLGKVSFSPADLRLFSFGSTWMIGLGIGLWVYALWSSLTSLNLGVLVFGVLANLESFQSF